MASCGTLSAAQTCGERGQLARGGAAGFPGRRARTVGQTDARVLPGPSWSAGHCGLGAREREGASHGMPGREALVLPRRESGRAVLRAG